MTNIIKYFGEDLDLDTLKRVEGNTWNCFKVRYFDSKGNVLINEDLNGGWTHFKYNRFKMITEIERSNGYWSKTTYDKYGNELRSESSTGYWCETTRDKDGLELTWKSSDNEGYKYTRDSEGNLLSHENSNGLVTYLAGDRQYGLHYKEGKYYAGCRVFIYKAAKKHWTERSKDNKKIVRTRAKKFLEAIGKHQEELKK